MEFLFKEILLLNNKVWKPFQDTMLPLVWGLDGSAAIIQKILKHSVPSPSRLWPSAPPNGSGTWHVTRLHRSWLSVTEPGGLEETWAASPTSLQAAFLLSCPVALLSPALRFLFLFRILPSFLLLYSPLSLYFPAMISVNDQIYIHYWKNFTEIPLSSPPRFHH